MAYQNTTPGKYRIPYWASGERASQQSNLRAAQIAENEIYAAMSFFGANGVITEGTYTGTFNAGGNSTVTLASNATSDALVGVVDFKYVDQLTALQWTGLPDSTASIYLYAQAVEQNLYTTSQLSTLQDKVVQAVWNTSGQTPATSILLAIATTTGSSITVNSSSTITDNGSYTSGKPIFNQYGVHYSVTSGISSPMGYSGRVPFNRTLFTVLPDPVTSGYDEVLLPGLRYPTTITEVMVEARATPYSTCTFSLRNASGGGGSGITATLNYGERYGSGIGSLSLTTAVAFRPTSVTSLFSGLSVYISGYTSVPSPGADNL